MRTATRLFLLALLPFAARAQEPELPIPLPPEDPPALEAPAVAEPAAKKLVPVTLAVLGGGLFPQVVSALGTSPHLGLEVGWIAPVLEERLQVSLGALYGQPSFSSTISDPRLAGGTTSFTAVEQVVDLTAGGLYRFKAPGTRLVPFAGLGLRVQLQRTRLDGASGGQALGEHRETATSLGAVASGGVEYRLGPGAVLGRVDLAWAGLNHALTGDVNNGGLSLLVGYRLFLER